MKVFFTLCHPYYDKFIILIIMLSSIQLALSSPRNDPNDPLAQTLEKIDMLTTLIFAVEVLLKIIAGGFYWNGKHSYLKSRWNLADFLIMILSVVSLMPLQRSLRAFKVLRTVRVLRLVGKNEGLKIGLHALLKATPNIVRTFSIMFLFFLIFGIITVSFFKGAFYYCQSTQASGLPNYSSFVINQKWDCLNTGGDWQNRYYNFDNILYAMVTLFIICNVSGWQDYMYFAVQTTEMDYTWYKWTKEYQIALFIIFIVIGSFFLLNLLVGVVISSFNREKDQLSGYSLLTEKQKEWVAVHTRVLSIKPEKIIFKPTNAFRLFCYNLISKKYFINICTAIIILNCLNMSLFWQG